MSPEIATQTHFYLIPEMELSTKDEQELTQLLQDLFIGFPQRSQFVQVPHFRVLAKIKGQIVGHISVTQRLVRQNENVIKIFFISDVCVKEDYMGLGLASKLLSMVADKAKKNNIPFLFAVAPDKSLYLKNDFKEIKNNGNWLMIRESNSIGLMRSPLPSHFMVAQLGKEKLNEAAIDFLGPLI